jgi:hypothetical protein
MIRISFGTTTVSPIVEPLISLSTVLFRCRKVTRGRWWPMLVPLMIGSILSFRKGCLTRFLSGIVTEVRICGRVLMTTGGSSVMHGMFCVGETTATRHL